MSDLVLRQRQILRDIPAPVLFAFAFLGVLTIFALTADAVAPYDYARQDLTARLRPPLFFGGTLNHILGTDHLGRDVLSRLGQGARISVLIALCGTAFGAVLGTFLGFLAAHFKGFCEDTVMMFADIQAAIPALVLALAIIAFFGNSLFLFIVLIGLDGWERYARLTRGLVLTANTSGYVASMRMIGASPPRIYMGQILPNIIGPLIVQATLNFPGAIMLEAALSFLGLGIMPPMTSLGQILGQGRAYLLNAWWIAVFPGATIFLTTLAMCLIGDWLRDRLDPTTSRNKA